LPASAKSRHATAGVLSAAFIGWLAVAQYLGGANTYFASTDTAVPCGAIVFFFAVAHKSVTLPCGQRGG
jgi:hypothetical protein